MRRIMQMALILILFIGGGQKRCWGNLPENLHGNEVVFVYVHGFGEFKELVPFEDKMRQFLQRFSLKSTVFTYRWDLVDIKLTEVVSQWNQAKMKADEQAKVFMDEVIMKLEANRVPYFIIAYSLGSRVAAESLQYANEPLQYLHGIYFLGSALPYTYTLKGKCLPAGMKIISYYSAYLDEVLKISFYNAEGIKAGGEVGFADTQRFLNYRTVCTHVHKGGPLERDYSNLAAAIGYVSLFRESIFIDGESPDLNIELPVTSGSLHWNDILQFESPLPQIVIQQNVNTHHYRAVEIDQNGNRVRKAWGANLHSILQQLQLFSAPYSRIVREKE